MFISLTRLHLRSLRYLPAFLWINEKVVKQLPGSQGFVAGKLLVAGPREFWTATVWADEHSMRQYRGTGAHRKAMGRLPEWCDEASVAHWEQQCETIPVWKELQRRMEQTGRRSRVNHPSQDHSAEPWKVRPPRWRLERPIQRASAAALPSS